MIEEEDFGGGDLVEYETGKFAVCVYIKGSD